jgi:CubicO group peptidase (beta-lactamase class C family)
VDAKGGSTVDPVRGHTAPGYGGVRERLAALVDEGSETGAALAVSVGGRVVVDLVAGWADASRSRAWRADTLVHTYSVSKPFAALAVLVLAREGLVTLDTRVADVWPEYGCAGKEHTTVGHLLTHQAGLPAFGSSSTSDDLMDRDGLTTWLARAEPQWSPGTAHGEHALTYGHLLDGVVRAVAGQSLGELFRTRVARALGWDAWFGLPLEDLDRVADLEYRSPLWPQDIAGPSGTLRHRALNRPPGALEVTVLNHRRWRQAEFPAIGMHASARGVLGLYDQMLRPHGDLEQLLGNRWFDSLVEPQVVGWDRTLERDVTWTTAMQRDGSDVGLGGIGGSVGFASLDKGYAFAYVTRALGDHTRADLLVAEVEEVLGR